MRAHQPLGTTLSPEAKPEPSVDNSRHRTGRYPELKHIPLYTRFQRARQGELRLHDAVPLQCGLVRLDGRPTSVGELLPTTSPLPTVLVAGSYS
jgi:hypothetical protein